MEPSFLACFGHEAGTTGVDISADQQTIVSVGFDNLVKYWRISDGFLIRVGQRSYLVESLPCLTRRMDQLVALSRLGRDDSHLEASDGSLVRVITAPGCD